MQRIWQGVGTFVLVLGLSTTVRAAAPAGADSVAASDAAEVITIDLDVADLPESRANIAPVVHAELQRLLSEQPQLPAGVVLLEDRRLLVELRPGPIPGADDVLIRVVAQFEGTMLGETETENCLSCSDEQVAQKALPMLRPLLEQFPAPPRAAAPPPVTGDMEAGEAANTLPAPARPKRELLIAGGSLLGAGVVGLGVGIGLIVANERVVSDPGAADLELIQYRPAGLGFAIGGGVAAVTGAALLGLALGRHKRSGVAAGPVLTPNSYGVALSGRF